MELVILLVAFAVVSAALFNTLVKKRERWYIEPAITCHCWLADIDVMEGEEVCKMCSLQPIRASFTLPFTSAFPIEFIDSDALAGWVYDATYPIVLRQQGQPDLVFLPASDKTEWSNLTGLLEVV